MRIATAAKKQPMLELIFETLAENLSVITNDT